MLQFRAALTDDSRVVIYDRNMFIVQATGGRSVLIRHFYFERMAEEVLGESGTAKFCNNAKIIIFSIMLWSHNMPYL